MKENLTIIKKAIYDQHGSVYAYCQEFQLSQGHVSRFLKGETSHSAKLMERHCTNLNLKLKILVEKPTGQKK
jgi:transcriptional regulator with XRE-family HTH domain